MPPALPSIYTDHAAWYHLFTAPEEYAEEAAFYTRLIREASARPPRTLLELGSGGGNMAAHYVADFEATLSDISPENIGGLFSRDTWLRLLAEAGFTAHPRLLEHSEVPLGEVEVFVAVRPG